MAYTDPKARDFEQRVRCLPPVRRYAVVLVGAPFVVLPSWPLVCLLYALVLGIVLGVADLHHGLLTFVLLLVGMIGATWLLVGGYEMIAQMWRDWRGLDYAAVVRARGHDLRRQARFLRPLGRRGQLVLAVMVVGPFIILAPVLGLLTGAILDRQTDDPFVSTVLIDLGFLISIIGTFCVSLVFMEVLAVRFVLHVVARQKGRRRAIRHCLHSKPYRRGSRWSGIRWRLYGVTEDGIEAARRRQRPA